MQGMRAMICVTAIPEPSAPALKCLRAGKEALYHACREVQMALETSFHHLTALLSSVLALNSPAI